MAKVLVRFSRPPGTAVATFKLAQQAAAAAMLQHWHTTYVPGHFQTPANKRYGYQPRVGDNEPPRLPRQDGKPGTRNNPHYSWKKRREKRHNRPLVFSGDSEIEATDPANFQVRQLSANIARGVFSNMPAYWYRYHKAGVFWRRNWYAGLQPVVVNQQPNKAEELTRVTAAELQDMARVGEARLASFMNHYRPPASGAA